MSTICQLAHQKSKQIIVYVYLLGIVNFLNKIRKQVSTKLHRRIAT